jgi:DNA/RNA endonuclease YhcR with UshA esterase domain
MHCAAVIARRTLSIGMFAALALSAAATDAQCTVISDAEAAAHVGAQVCVRGQVANVYVSAKGNVFINFGRRYPDQTFTAVVFVGDTRQFPDLTRLTGRKVQVAGVIQLYKGRPEIIARTPDQLSVLE